MEAAASPNAPVEGISKSVQSGSGAKLAASVDTGDSSVPAH